MTLTYSIVFGFINQRYQIFKVIITNSYLSVKPKSPLQKLKDFKKQVGDPSLRIGEAIDRRDTPLV